MPTFDTTEQIHQYILKNAEEGLQQTLEKIKIELVKYVEKYWYGRENGTHNYYNRTMEFVDSITASKVKIQGNTLSGEVFFDTTKIGSYNDYPNWGQHQGLHGENVSELIPWYIEEGNKSSAYEYEGIHMVKNITLWAKHNNVPLKEIMSFLKTKGFQCEIR